MTDIRQLLHEATDDIEVNAADPVSRVGRATARRRRTRGATVVVVIAVAAAIVLPLTLPDHSESTTAVRPSPTATASRHAVIEMWAPRDGEVAAGFGSIWGLGCCGGTTPTWVDQLNPTTGRQIARIRVPGPAAHVAVGAGRVWTIGANAGGGGSSAISAIDPATSTVSTLHLTNPQAEPYDIAFAGGSAWVTMQLLNQVWRLTPTPTGISKSVISVSGGPNQIATTGDGSIWVQRQDIDRLSRIVPDGEAGRLDATAKWPGSIFTASPGAGNLWASASQHTITELSPLGLSTCPRCLSRGNGVTVQGQVVAVANTAQGLYAATERRTYFYDFRAVRDDAVTATASIPYGATSLTPDGAGIVIGTASAGLIHWVPNE